MKYLCNKFNIIGCQYNNAYIESFHAFLKKEEIYRNIYKNHEDAKKAIFEYSLSKFEFYCSRY